MPADDARLKRWSLISAGLCFGFALLLPIAIILTLTIGPNLSDLAAEEYGVAYPGPLPLDVAAMVWAERSKAERSA